MRFVFWNVVPVAAYLGVLYAAGSEPGWVLTLAGTGMNVLGYIERAWLGSLVR